jgi:surface polysaccharide O-acyltransferase-like enzyme
METEKINRRPRFIVRWSPLFFVLATVWAFFSWRHHPVSIPYVLACVAIGLFCGALIIADNLKHSTPLLYVLWIVVFISAPMFLNALFFPNLDRNLGKMSYQYMSVVVASILGLVTILRNRILRHFAEADAEQIVGPERR